MQYRLLLPCVVLAKSTYVDRSDTVSSASLEFPVWIIINSVEPAQSSDPPPVLSFIKHIYLKRVTCSSTCLHSLFSTLLKLDHQVECRLECDITSCVDGSDICTYALIRTNSDNEFDMQTSKNDSPGLWEALHNLNIKSLRLMNEDANCIFGVKHKVLFTQFLSSLQNLETLKIEVDFSIHSLLKATHGLNIKRLSLSLNKCPSLSQTDAFGYLTVNRVESLSQCLASLTQLKTLSIRLSQDLSAFSDFEDSPGLWEALRGLNIKSLKMSDMFGSFSVNHLESLSQSLSSLTQLETLSISLNGDIPDLWEALRGLHIKSLSLRDTWNVNHVESFSQSLSSLTQLETLSIGVPKDSTGPWEALRGLHLKSLSLSNMFGSLSLNHVNSMSRSLSSLTQLETLSISLYGDIHGLLEALHGLHIKSLILRQSWRGRIVNHEESSSQSLLSLKQLETLRIDVNSGIPSLWNALHGLTVKSLSLDDTLISLLPLDVDPISKFISSLTKLETLSLRTYWYDSSSGLWEVLSSLNIKHLILKVESNIIVNQVKTSSQALSSLTQLKTLSIRVSKDCPGLWETLHGLNIKSLSLSYTNEGCHGMVVNHVESMSQSLSSLTKLESLSICVSEPRPGLWEALRSLNIKSLSVND